MLTCFYIPPTITASHVRAARAAGQGICVSVPEAIGHASATLVSTIADAPLDYVPVAVRTEITTTDLGDDALAARITERARRMIARTMLCRQGWDRLSREATDAMIADREATFTRSAMARKIGVSTIEAGYIMDAVVDLGWARTTGNGAWTRFAAATVVA